MPLCETAVGGFNCTMDCHSVQSEAQTRPRKFLENEIEKERKETFDMRVEEL